ncbi:hypothetical protein BJY16_001768 [Actinoplanes octamycinicus]|uniref:Excreted virulence factor EspC (Type VII ESX diderm) n=1 Tax=Actinoplanes octamycinicus TaxID=135948 RepID=A0A7W7GU25_9ACTN|nr:hypothetical protein [Actinoplanes octamycinicus]MBB4738309.1 hypothetical protein [Actinoplanes octamycinicus]GIE57426.1 hypothetical protein Aoc01nite_28280 [Actinoplanes octamycinicus]
MHPHLEIDVEALVRTGTQVQDSSGSVREAITKEVGWLTVASVGIPWAAVGVVADRANGWSTYLQDLAERIRLSGAGMVGAAINYQTTDQESADSITATFPTPAPHHGPHMGAAE